jgi:alkanesulfonate monooxygenase SsuD/methylene tetrahydromethanopterin reductase-like flavin-dependent oxidoreductase (luciferase family)
LSLANYTVVLKSDPTMPDEELTLDILLEDLVIHGSPKTVAEKIEDFRSKTAPFGKLILAMQDWEHDRAGQENTMKLLAKEVLPLVNKMSPKRAVA